ncbi:MAG TPA: glycosyltransferase [Opitutaceae bacterium]|nr:glycosyltransferase [Opitutaceae bacterium]
MRIAQLVASLDARHGGPSRSVRATAEALAARGHEVELLATSSVERSAAEGGVVVREFRRESPAMLVVSSGLRRHLASNAYDVLHAHGLWTRQLAYARAASANFGSRFVISPRGMLAPWALRHHPLRKRLARQFVHPGAFSGADGWHATSPGEAGEITAAGFTQPVCVAPNGVDIPNEADLAGARRWWQTTEPALASGKPVALFHSRFHKKKRVLELIDLWASLPDTGWLLALVGIPEDYSVDALKEKVFEDGLANRVVVDDGTEAPQPYATADLFLLPTHSENFGLVVAEALAAGVPALVTDTAPWSALAPNGAGWCVSWESYRETLATALATPREQLAAMGARGRAWVGESFPWSRTAQLLEEFYKQLE